MAKSTWLKVLIGFFLSLCIAFYVNQFLKSLKEEIKVVVASKEIQPQTKITSDMLTTISVSTADQKLLAPDAVKEISSAIGSVTLVRLRAGEVITNHSDKLIQQNRDGGGNISASNQRVNRALFIPEGKRTMAIRIDSEGSLGFTLEKGDKVDVILTATGGELGGIYSNVILQRMEIFDVEPIADKDKTNNGALQNITLIVSPQQAQQLALAKRKGKIDLVLNPLNSSQVNNPITGPTLPSDLLNMNIKR